jgi:large subunit ribosomal protein L10
LAISKVRKQEIITEYTKWLSNSRALVLAEYKGLTMSQLDELRSKMREAGGEFHIIKNTLGKRAFQDAGYVVPENYFEGTTAIGFTYNDVPALAKMITEYERTSDFLKLKGGYLGPQTVTPAEIKALADLPPLPVLRAQLLGTLMAPASRLARLLSEPARQVAAVLKAYADRSPVPEA